MGRLPLSLVACFCFVAAQVGGFHMHVDAHGNAGVPSGTHIHGTDRHHHDASVGHTHGHEPHGHASSNHEHGPEQRDRGDPDHDGDRDVASADLGAIAAKVLILGAALGSSLPIARAAHARIRAPRVITPRKTRRVRWRPPLRGPPSFSPTEA